MTFPTQEHIDAAQTAAARVKADTGFYCWPSVTLAQAVIESARWTILSGKNNGFGIKATQAQIAAGKATSRTTREVINGKNVMIDAWFADFASLADAYEAHARLFVRVGVYAPALKAATADAFLAGIAPHYATDPSYQRVIQGVMRDLNLYRYDAPSAPLSPAPPPPAPVPSPAPVPPPAPPAPVPVPAPLPWFRRLLAWLGL